MHKKTRATQEFQEEVVIADMDLSSGEKNKERGNLGLTGGGGENEQGDDEPCKRVIKPSLEISELEKKEGSRRRISAEGTRRRLKCLTPTKLPGAWVENWRCGHQLKNRLKNRRGRGTKTPKIKQKGKECQGGFRERQKKKLKTQESGPRLSVNGSYAQSPLVSREERRL